MSLDQKKHLCLKCHICGVTYTRSTKLKAHARNKHNIELEMGNSKRTKCTYPGCEELFYHKSKMIDHLNEFHQVEAKKQVINFENEKLFMDWKEKEELKNFVYYSKQRGDGESKLLIHKYFICQHDGDERPHRKDGDPARKSNRKFRRGQIKTGSFCPSRIICHLNKVTNKVRVEYISAHSHPVNLANTVFQPIPTSTRQEIKAKLSIGIPVNEVYKDLREGMGNRESRLSNECITRAHLISKTNISDMRRHMKYARRLHPDDSTSTHLIVKKLQLESYNCVIVYKPQGQAVETGPGMYNDIDVKKDLFVIGIQTKEQLEMFQKRSNKIHCIDSTHNTNKYKFPLTTIIVPDEFNRGYPVAWLIQIMPTS